MAYKAIFKGWENLTITDLLVAYRKAKADCFFENNICPTAVNFAEYECNLLVNLRSLLKKLKENNGFTEPSRFLDKLLGNYILLPKKLSIKKDLSENSNHIHFSDPKRAFEQLSTSSELIPELRIIGDFPVETHIISALWINMIGHKFDECLDDKICYASRLKRTSDENEICPNEKPKKNHITSIRTFQSYLKPYNNFRRHGIEIIRNELNSDRNVIAVSLDLKSYYHTLDPMALSSEDFLNNLGLTGDKKLSQDELFFTKELSLFLSFWSERVRESELIDGQASGGLVMGLTVSQIIANVMLHAWDKSVKEKLSPIFYGRYVDDMFIVLRDSGNIHSTKDFMSLLVKHLGSDYLYPTSATTTDPVWEIQQGQTIQGKSKISFQPEKQKLFILSGQNGLDLLANVEKGIQELSSEHRLMSSPDDFQNSAAVNVLTAVSNAGESADTLRRTDGLTIQRLGLTLQLKHIETLTRYLPKNEWQNERFDFYEFIKNHVLCTTNLFTNFRYLPRILGISVTLGEWKETSCLVECVFNSLSLLLGQSSCSQTIVINGIETLVSEAQKTIILDSLKESFSWSCFDVIARYDNEFCNTPSKKSPQRSKLEEKLKNLVQYVDLEPLENYSAYILIADLSFKPYKEIWKSQKTLNHLKKELLNKRHITNGRSSGRYLSKEDTGILDLKYLKDFLHERNKNRRLEASITDVKQESILPYLFPTRPYTPAEIAEIDPKCINNAELWRQYTKTLRGTWVKNQSPCNEKKSDDSNLLEQYKVGSAEKGRVTIALSNFKTDDQDWSEMADNKSKLKLERYQRIAELVNQAIKLEPRPDYLVFPELSIPIKWIDCIANKLMTAGISLIAGTEYHHHGDKKIFSEACLVLSDDRLGYPSWIKIWQPKLEPAVKEEKDLISKFGRSWQCLPISTTKLSKPTYNHNGFHFGLMICSELQNSKSRVEFQGQVDALFVLAWNQDLETFSSLVDAASLDIHAYTILVNNRTYGDSRVRSPAKQSFNRDLARVRGGENDFIVSVTLDVNSLRAFQSREKRWPEESDEFKPVPEGYKISSSRKTIPSL